MMAARETGPVRFTYSHTRKIRFTHSNTHPDIHIHKTPPLGHYSRPLSVRWHHRLSIGTLPKRDTRPIGPHWWIAAINSQLGSHRIATISRFYQVDEVIYSWKPSVTVDPLLLTQILRTERNPWVWFLLWATSTRKTFWRHLNNG